MTYRFGSAVSIARRLQDPLAELVKIDPKAIGVGQYQHDMPRARLDETLAGVVENCVNTVGVDLNTASFSLLSHVAGINAAVAKNIVAWREENGLFSSRKQLQKVNKLGKKAYEQCAGFLRVPESADLLDNTAVHPESYEAARAFLRLCGCSAEDIKNGRMPVCDPKSGEIPPSAAGRPAGRRSADAQDIVAELSSRGAIPVTSCLPRCFGPISFLWRI